VSYILRSWRQIERGVQLDLAHHHRRIGTHAQAQQIFDPGLIHGYVEVDVPWRPGSPWTRTTYPRATRKEWRNWALTGCRYVSSPSVPSTIAWNSVCGGTLCPLIFTWKFRRVGLAIHHNLVQGALASATTSPFCLPDAITADPGI
jgi:hypothetical protein